MDDYTKALIRYRFEDIKRMNPTVTSCKTLCNWMIGYLVALDDRNIITREECDKAVENLKVWAKEQKEKTEAVQKMCEEQWEKQGLYVATVTKDGND